MSGGENITGYSGSWFFFFLYKIIPLVRFKVAYCYSSGIVMLPSLYELVLSHPDTAQPLSEPELTSG